MAMPIKSNVKSRFSDIGDEPVDRLLSPIRGYEDQPLLPLIETIKPFSRLFKDIQDYSFVALHNSQNPDDALDQQESAAIHLYTMQFDDGPSLYQLLNQSLRAENRQQLKPWFLFLKLFLTALYKLPSQRGIVWRGIKNVDFSSKYKTGTKFAWWGVSSCTTHVEVLETDDFLGKTGQRTLFSIECINGKSIANHSYFKHTEKEVVLMPGSYFEVISQVNPAPQLYIIHVKEIEPPIQLVKPPFLKSTSINQSKLSMNYLVHSVSQLSVIPNVNINQKWKQYGTTRAGGYARGNGLNQLYNPRSVYMDDDQTIYVADYSNHRIVKWKSDAISGQIVAAENDPLKYPTKVIVDKENDSLIICDYGNRRIVRWPRRNGRNGETLLSNIDCSHMIMNNDGYLYVSDTIKHEVRRWKLGETNGRLVAGGNGQGDRLDQLSYPEYIFIDQDHSVYVSDYGNHRVMKWLKGANEGIAVAGGQGQGNSLRQLSSPRGIIVDQLGNIYVADAGNNRVMRWLKGAKEGTIVVGGNGGGVQPNQLNDPVDLSFDRQNNLYVVDSGNDRIQKFDVNSN